MKLLSNTFLQFLVAIFVGVYVSSCKPPDPPKLNVIVVDSAKTKVAGATVVITSSGIKNGKPEKGIVTANGVTGSDGVASFEFKLDAMVNITAYKLASNGDTIRGRGMGKLVSGEVTETTITIRRNN